MYFVDLSQFAFLPFATKAIVVGSLTTLPMLFSGLIFIDSFAKTKHKDSALGANLMGALVGGALQSVTYVIGIKALLLVVAALYLAAIVCAPRHVTEPKDDDRRDDDTEGNLEANLLKTVTSLQASLSESLNPGEVLQPSNSLIANR